MTSPQGRSPPFRNAWDTLRRSRHSRTQAARRWILNWMLGRQNPRATDFLDSEWRLRLPFEFEHRFWELYVAAAALEAGLPLHSGRTAGQADIVSLVGSERKHIECVATTSGIDGNPDRVQMPTPGIAERVPVRDIELRILSIVSEKIAYMHKRSARGAIGRDDHYYIAVNIRGATQMRGDSQPPYALRAAFGIGDIVVPFDRDTMESQPPFVWTQDVLVRSSGAAVPKGFLSSVTTAPAQLSGILFAQVDAFNHPGLAGAPLSSAFSYIPNPFALKPAPNPPIPARIYQGQVEAGSVVGYSVLLQT